MIFRCPVDDKVFQTRRTDRVPTQQGHPDCDGPECTKNFKGWKPAPEPEPEVAVAVAEQPAGVSLEDPSAFLGW